MYIERSQFFISADKDGDVDDWDCWEEVSLFGKEIKDGILWDHIEGEKEYLIDKMIEKNPEYEELILREQGEYEVYVLPTNNRIIFSLKRR